MENKEKMKTIVCTKLHELPLNLDDTLPQITNRKEFIFSTSAITEKAIVVKYHSPLREKLQSKGYTIFDDFACKGFKLKVYFHKYDKPIKKVNIYKIKSHICIYH